MPGAAAFKKILVPVRPPEYFLLVIWGSGLPGNMGVIKSERAVTFAVREKPGP